MKKRGNISFQGLTSSAVWIEHDSVVYGGKNSTANLLICSRIIGINATVKQRTSAT